MQEIDNLTCSVCNMTLKVSFKEIRVEENLDNFSDE